MANRTKRSCQVCGKPFYGGEDNFYCPDCARQKKFDAVVKIRTCQDCGIEFYGGPRARRCPECAYKARLETSRQHKKIGAKRPLGSVDKCAVCGKEYIVISGRQKYCSDACQRIGVLKWQREHKKGYNKESGQDAKKREHRRAQEKICVYCLRKFKSDKPTNLCSDYCRAEQKMIQQCIADINRGRGGDYDGLIKLRDQYRESVKKSEDLSDGRKMSPEKYRDSDLRVLSKMQREYFGMALSGMKFAEIAKQRGCSKQNVYATIDRAIKKLESLDNEKEQKKSKKGTSTLKKSRIKKDINIDFNQDLSFLTEREVEVLKLRKSGLGYAEIAALLSITTSCVGKHLNNARRKLDGDHTRSQMYYKDEAHKKHAAEYHKRYYSERVEKLSEYNKQYYQKNREKILERSANKDKSKK